MNRGTPFAHMQLPVKDICINMEYQRNLDESRVRKIVASFNPDLVNPLKVNSRDNRFWLFDGQHTLSALKAKFGEKGLLVDCKVYHNQAVEWEAKMFAEQNGVSRIVQTEAKLRALYKAGDVDVVDFYDVTKSLGVKMDFTKGPGINKIQAVATAFKIYKKSLPDYLETVGILKEAYPSRTDTYANQLLIGISDFHAKYKEKYKRALLVSQLQRTTPMAIIAESKLYIKEGRERYSNRILHVYNYNTRSSRL